MVPKGVHLYGYDSFNTRCRKCKDRQAYFFGTAGLHSPNTFYCGFCIMPGAVPWGCEAHNRDPGGDARNMGGWICSLCLEKALKLEKY